MPRRVYIGIGSNLGDRRQNTVEAMGRVGALGNTKVVRTSSFYESEPLGDAKTWFVNSGIEVERDIPTEQLRKKLPGSEESMGRRRVKGKRWGSRVIAFDTPMAAQEVTAKRALRAPPPERHKGRFVPLP